jgi:hypothetical protein
LLELLLKPSLKIGLTSWVISGHPNQSNQGLRNLTGSAIRHCSASMSYMVTESSDAIASKRPDRGWKRTCIEAPCKQMYLVKLAESHSLAQIGIQPQMTDPQLRTGLSRKDDSGQKERLLSGLRHMILFKDTTFVRKNDFCQKYGVCQKHEFCQKEDFCQKDLSKMPIFRCLQRAQKQESRPTRTIG